MVPELLEHYHKTFDSIVDQTRFLADFHGPRKVLFNTRCQVLTTATLRLAH